MIEDDVDYGGCGYDGGDGAGHAEYKIDDVNDYPNILVRLGRIYHIGEGKHHVDESACVAKCLQRCISRYVLLSWLGYRARTAPAQHMDAC